MEQDSATPPPTEQPLSPLQTTERQTAATTSSSIASASSSLPPPTTNTTLFLNPRRTPSPESPTPSQYQHLDNPQTGSPLNTRDWQEPKYFNFILPSSPKSPNPPQSQQLDNPQTISPSDTRQWQQPKYFNFILPSAPENTQPQTATTSSSAAASASSSVPPPITTTIQFRDTKSTSSQKPRKSPQSKHSKNSQTTQQLNTRRFEQPNYFNFFPPSPSEPASSASTSSSVFSKPLPLGGMAVRSPSPSIWPRPPTPFSSLSPPSYGQQSQLQALRKGISGAHGSTSSMRPSNQLRVSQLSPRPLYRSHVHSPTAQNFQGDVMSASSSQNSQPQYEPRFSSGTQGRPRQATPPLGPQRSNESFQQQQPFGFIQYSPQYSAPEHFSQQFPALRIQQPITHQGQEHISQQSPSSRIQQQEINRVLQLGIQRPPLGLKLSKESILEALNKPATVEPERVLPLGTPRLPLGLKLSIDSVLEALNKPATVEPEDCSKRILSRRSIQEPQNQTGPSAKFDPEVEDILVDITEDSAESVATSGCSLDRRRRSSSLEATDIRESGRDMALPGLGGDTCRRTVEESSSAEGEDDDVAKGPAE